MWPLHIIQPSAWSSQGRLPISGHSILLGTASWSAPYVPTPLPVLGHLSPLLHPTGACTWRPRLCLNSLQELPGPSLLSAEHSPRTMCALPKRPATDRGPRTPPFFCEHPARVGMAQVFRKYVLKRVSPSFQIFTNILLKYNIHKER